MDTFRIKKSDMNPALAVTLQYNDETAVNLTNGSCWFVMSNGTDFTPYHSGLCFITGSTTGQAEYRWDGSNDTGSIGTFWGEFEVVWTGSRMTLPNDHSLKINVYEDYN